jgi:hypothetical protein
VSILREKVILTFYQLICLLKMSSYSQVWGIYIDSFKWHLITVWVKTDLRFPWGEVLLAIFGIATGNFTRLGVGTAGQFLGVSSDIKSGGILIAKLL